MKKRVKLRICIAILLLLVITVTLGAILYIQSDVYYAKQLISAIEDGDCHRMDTIIDGHPGSVNTCPTLVPLWMRRAVDSAAIGYPLHIACKVGNIEAVQKLLSAGAEVNVVDDLLNDTPLLYCLSSRTENRYEIAEILLDHGADVTIRRKNNGTYDALECCCIYMDLKNNSTDTVDRECAVFNRLLEMVDRDSYDFKTLFRTSIFFNNEYAVKQILERSLFAIDGILSDGKNGLMLSAGRGNIAIVKLLLDYGADKTIVDETGRTAYDYAVERGNSEIAELLKP